MTLTSKRKFQSQGSEGRPSTRRKMVKTQSSMNQAYNSVTTANRKAHQNNKRYYDRRSKSREFKTT